MTLVVNALPNRPELDSTPEFQRSLDQSSQRKEPALVRTGRYWFNGVLSMSDGSSLIGDGRGPYDQMVSPANTVQGPTLLPRDKSTQTGYPFLKSWGASCAVDDLIFCYPDQTAYDDPGAGVNGPKHYPPTIEAVNPIKVRRNTFCNGWIDLNILVGRCYVEDNHMGGLKHAVVIDNAADTVRLNNNACQHFNGWGYNTPQALAFWCRNNSIAILARRVDSLKIDGLIVNNRKVGIQLESSSLGVPYGSAVNVDLDNVRYGIVASATNASVGFCVSNLDLGGVAGEGGEYAIWLQRGNTNPRYFPRVSVVGGSIRDPWKPGNLPTFNPKINGRGFQVDAGELYLSRIIGYDLGGRL